MQLYENIKIEKAKKKKLGFPESYLLVKKIITEKKQLQEMIKGGFFVVSQSTRRVFDFFLLIPERFDHLQTGGANGGKQTADHGKKHQDWE